MKKNTMETFWSRIDRQGPDECWNWTGTIGNHGYGVMRLEGKYILAHRKAYFQHYGHDAPHDVDHICRNRRCVNPAHLREATRGQNLANSPSRTTLPKGVSFCKQTKKFIAQITVKGKTVWLGRHKKVEEADKAYQEEAKEAWGQFHYDD